MKVIYYLTLNKFKWSKGGFWLNNLGFGARQEKEFS